MIKTPKVDYGLFRTYTLPLSYLIEEIKKSKDFNGVSGEISEVALNMLLLWYLLFIREGWHGLDTEVMSYSCSASVFCALYGT